MIVNCAGVDAGKLGVLEVGDKTVRHGIINAPFEKVLVLRFQGAIEIDEIAGKEGAPQFEQGLGRCGQRGCAGQNGQRFYLRWLVGQGFSGQIELRLFLRGGPATGLQQRQPRYAKQEKTCASRNAPFHASSPGSEPAPLSWPADDGFFRQGRQTVFPDYSPMPGGPQEYDFWPIQPSPAMRVSSVYTATPPLIRIRCFPLPTTPARSPSWSSSPWAC
jgi:hypothetical protein